MINISANYETVSLYSDCRMSVYRLTSKMIFKGPSNSKETTQNVQFEKLRLSS
jgi:hypothetical protein